jgi:glycosyltransferase involved in cell wall biosynthesis
MRIVNVITRLNIGGASSPVISLAAGLRKRGHESILVTGVPEPSEGSMEGEAQAAGAPLIRIPELRRNINPARDLKAFIKLIQVFQNFRPDVVATHMSKAGALGRLAAKLTGVPVIAHTYHGQGFEVFTQRWKEKIVLLLERALARIGTVNIVVSEKQKADFMRLSIGKAQKLRVIRYGLDLHPYLNADPQSRTFRIEMGLPDSVKLIGVVGRLVAIKGHEVFLHATARLAQTYPTAHFLVVGDGERRNDLQSLALALGVGERVHFLGWRRDIPTILAGLDVVVLPTILDFEGTPLAVIEALACAKPVVATCVGGVPELVRDGETGLLVPPRDPEALANAMARLLDDAFMGQQLGASGRALVCKVHERERMVDETERWFLQLLQAEA